MMLIDNESWINEHVSSESSGSTKFDPSHYQANKMFNKLLVLVFLLQTYKHTHKYTMITTTKNISTMTKTINTEPKSLNSFPSANTVKNITKEQAMDAGH